ncbi:hypothetical protein [Reichenbachiella versicolor]|uniref:hypothetical protein n=1 Tax=Reichenbachiella versicolor TaxID=1821036 RepID=UPI000D6DF29A|nr:hypothetical protein [Reichenbachiella versicolor]
MSENKDSKLSNQLFELFKWLIGTIGLGFTGIFINEKIQSTELEINHETQTTELKIKRLEADARFLEVVTSDIGEEVVNSEIKYLEYILTFVTTPEIKKEIQEKIVRKKALKIREEASKAKTQESKEINLIKGKLSAQQIRDFEEKRDEDESKQIIEPEKSIDDLKNEEQTIAPETEIINLGSNIDSLQKATTPTVIVSKEIDYILIGTPETKWVKKGYYIEFNDRLRIGVKSLDKNSITINLKDIENSSSSPHLLKNNITLSEGEIWVEDVKEYRHQITLNYIGAAGKNPFTKAAYITVSTYKKTAT